MRFWFSGVRFLRLTAGVAIVGVLFPALAGAQIVPATRVKVLLTALSFDRTLKEHADGGIVIGVLGSCDTSSALLEASGKSINGMPISIMALGDEGDLRGSLEKNNVDVLYICSAGNLGAVAATAAKLNIVTLAEKVDWVEDKLVLGVGDKDGRPELVLNMNAAKAAGADFDPRIFGVARVIK